jgi:hypothetical protein
MLTDSKRKMVLVVKKDLKQPVVIYLKKIKSCFTQVDTLVMKTVHRKLLMIS